MSGRISNKWRPSLALVLGLTLGAVLCLPLAGVVVVRYVAPVTGFREAAAIVALSVCAVTAILGFVLWRILLRPIQTLADRAKAIKDGSNGSLDPLAHYGTREMRDLGQAFLDMGRVLQGREAVLLSYADHATHELKSPLTVLRGAAELLDSPDLSDADRSRLLSRIDEAADRMTALLDAQRILAQAKEPMGLGHSRIGPLMSDLQLDHSEISLHLEADAILPLGPDGLRLVLDHLLGNATAVGALNVRIWAETGRLTVVDDGPGVSPGNRGRIFDPFFTTRRDEGGTGMGLAIVRRMLEAHGAEILLSPEGPPGATFVVLF